MAAEILNSRQIKALKEHKYSAEGSSICEPFMQVYWRWLVEQIPKTWAPNTITLVGLIINVVSTLILIFYNYDGTKEAPGWVYLGCAIGLFVYQSLDAIDGKQARRTKSNSPLGELFDHGCDSLSTGIMEEFKSYRGVNKLTEAVQLTLCTAPVIHSPVISITKIDKK